MTLPPIGSRIRVHHPWLEDGMEATVVSWELVKKGDSFSGSGDDIYDRYRVHLKDCVHCDGSLIDETYFDTYSCSWEYVHPDHVVPNCGD